MSFISNLFKRSLPDLATFIIERDKNKKWESINIELGSIPELSDELSLKASVDKISAAVADMYRQNGETTAELQFAIYPWGNESAVILLITKTDNGYEARDRQGSDLVITGSTFDDIVAAVPNKVDDPNTVMLQWIQPISELF